MSENHTRESFNICLKSENDNDENLSNKRFLILINLILCCVIEGLNFYDIFAYKLSQNSSDWFSYFSYSILYLISFIFLSIPSIYIIEIDIGISLILSFLCSIVREIFYIFYINYFFIFKEYCVFISIISMILLFNSLGKITHLWFPFKQSSYIISSFIYFIFFGGSISFFIHEMKLSDRNLIRISFIKIVFIILITGMLYNPLPKVYTPYKIKQKNLYINSKFKQIKECLKYFKQILITSMIMSSHLFLFLSYYDIKGNIIRLNSYLGIIFLSFIIGFIFISIYIYFIKEYKYLILIHLILSFVLLLLSFFFSIKEYFPFESNVKNFVFIILHIIIGINISIFLYLSYDYLIQLTYPCVGESVPISLFEIISSFFTLLLLIVNYIIRQFIFIEGQIYVELVIYFFPLIIGGILFICNKNNVEKKL